MILWRVEIDARGLAATASAIAFARCEMAADHITRAQPCEPLPRGDRPCIDHSTIGFDRDVDGTFAQGPMIDVADTIETCKLWFDTHKVPYAAADLLVMARMVMKREEEHADAGEERGVIRLRPRSRRL